jgi:site-specific DNA-cytosine methylase
LAHANRGGHPLSEPDEPAHTIVGKAEARGARGGGVLLAHERHPISSADAPARTVTTSGEHGSNGNVLHWPWDVPSTTVTKDERIPPPGHHPDAGSILSQPNAVVLSERARALLQGFPEGWVFHGKTKESRSSQIGQAMPPALAEAVFRAVAEMLRTAESEVA